jgi:hypothetical protein
MKESRVALILEWTRPWRRDILLVAGDKNGTGPCRSFGAM